MSQKLNWKKAKSPRPTESALGGGFRRHDGTISAGRPNDRLSRRAEAALAEWLRGPEKTKLRAELLPSKARGGQW